MSKSTTGMKYATAHDVHEPGLLAKCPYCQYLLTSLTVEHCCRGCGTTFNRRWQVFGGRNNSRRHTLKYRAFRAGAWEVMVACAFLGLILGGSALAALLGLVQLGTRTPRMTAAGVLWYCAIRMAAVVFKSPSSFMVVSDNGVSSHDSTNRREHIARSDLVGAKADQQRKQIVFEPKTWRPVTWPVQDVFGSNWAEMDACVAAINGVVNLSEASP